MDAYLSTSQNRSNYLDSPPVLIAADSENALARARQTAALSGLRVAEVGDLDGAPDRIRRQAAASALWIAAPAVQLERACPPARPAPSRRS